MASDAFTVEGIIAYKRSQKNQLQYLTRWKGSDTPSWEPRANFVNGWKEIVRGMNFMAKKDMEKGAIYGFDSKGASNLLFPTDSKAPIVFQKF